MIATMEDGGGVHKYLYDCFTGILLTYFPFQQQIISIERTRSGKYDHQIQNKMSEFFKIKSIVNIIQIILLPHVSYKP